MIALISDVNCEGHFRRIISYMESGWRSEIWQAVNAEILNFRDLSLSATTEDREIWIACQHANAVLVTTNRNKDGESSLETTIRELNAVDSLPVLTLADADKILADGEYAKFVADRMLEYLFEMDEFRGVGRLYLP